MKGLAKILIAVDLGVAAVVGAMGLYIYSGPSGPPDEAVPAESGEPVSALPASESGWDLTAHEPALLMGAGITLVACIALWLVLGFLERRRAATYAFEVPPPEPVQAPDPAAQREAAELFRAAAQRPDQPVFGRAPRRA
jgi:hypothetical protein